MYIGLSFASYILLKICELQQQANVNEIRQAKSSYLQVKLKFQFYSAEETDAFAKFDLQINDLRKHSGASLVQSAPVAEEGLTPQND